MADERTYIAIDLKSYYASAECAYKGLDPLTTNLVVADASRTEKTICLAVSPSLKAYGIPGRARLFEVIQSVNQINSARLQKAKRLGYQDFTGESSDSEELARDPSLKLSFIIAKPQMAYYLKTSARIYSIYGRYISSDDTLVYSIDEVFLDVTSYLKLYGVSARQLAMTMIKEVLSTTGITATAGIGSNLYLAKLAMDIVAKHKPADSDGVRIAELTEESFRYELWDHTPLTDFWMTGPGTVRHLKRLGVFTMGDLARFSLTNEDLLFKEFGVDAELMIDHAWGYEPCTMKQIKAYRPSENSISEGQVLSCPYTCQKARIIVSEMADSLVWQLTEKGLKTDSITMDVGYDRIDVDNGTYNGPLHLDHYGRLVPKGAHGTTRLARATDLYTDIVPACVSLFDRITDQSLSVRRMTLSANKVAADSGFFQMDLFADTGKGEKEHKLQDALLDMRKKYGKNAVLKGTNLLDGATMIERNGQIGGHKA